MKRRHQIRLPGDLRDQVGDYADKHGLRFAPAVRALLVEGLRHAGGELPGAADAASTAALAALIAAEQTGVMVASLLPGGDEKWLAAAAKAAQRAEERLAALERSMADEE